MTSPSEPPAPDAGVSGCGRCWPEDAAAAWTARAGLRHERSLVDESHFIVAILRCPHCAQAFLSVFTETVDWADGEDPQYRSLLPLTGEEVAYLGRLDPPREADLEAIGHERRSLAHDFPKGRPKTVSWRHGVRVFPHD